jgi:hypothetical protein
MSATMKLSILLFAALPLAAQIPSAHVAWSHEAGDLAHHRALAVNADGDALMAFTSFPSDKIRTAKSEKDLMNRLGIIEVNAAGDVVFDTDIPRPAEAMPKTRLGATAADIKGAAFLDDGEFVVAVEYVPEKAWLLRFDRSGKPISFKPLGAQPHSVSALVRAADGNLFVIGRASSDLLVAKYDLTGKRLWETRTSLGNTPFPRGAVAVPEGGVVLVTDVTTPDLHHAGPAEVVVAQYDANGAAGTQRRFNGRFGNIARDASGTIAVSYSADPTHVRVRMYDATLKETGDSSVEVSKAFVPDFQIAAVPDRGFVVYGSSELKPFLAVFGEGSIMEAPPELSIPMPMVATVVAHGDALYMASTEIHDENGHSGIRARLSKIALATTR